MVGSIEDSERSRGVSTLDAVITMKLTMRKVQIASASSLYMSRMPSTALLVLRVAVLPDQIVVGQTKPAEFSFAHLARHVVAALVLLDPPSARLPVPSRTWLAGLFDLLPARLLLLLALLLPLDAELPLKFRLLLGWRLGFLL